MATLTAGDVKETLIDIDRRRREVWKRRTEVRDKLNLERNRLYTAESERKGKVELLAGAEDDAMRGYLENEIDEVETRIGSHNRMIEGYEAAVAKIDLECAAIQKELDALNKAVEEQERQEAFNEWTVDYERAAQNAVAAIDAARVALARLALIGRQSEEFDEIGNFAGSLFRDRILSGFFAQIPPGSRGFERIHGPRANEMEFVIWPAARKGDLQ